MAYTTSPVELLHLDVGAIHLIGRYIDLDVYDIISVIPHRIQLDLSVKHTGHPGLVTSYIVLHRKKVANKDASE